MSRQLLLPVNIYRPNKLKNSFKCLLHSKTEFLQLSSYINSQTISVQFCKNCIKSLSIKLTRFMASVTEVRYPLDYHTTKVAEFYLLGLLIRVRVSLTIDLNKV